MDDEAISGFAAITGASPQVARHYLSLTDGNMEQGIQLFFDSPDLAAMGNEPPPVPHSSTRPAARPSTHTDSAGVVHLDSDDEEMEDDFEEQGRATPTRAATGTNSGVSGSGTYEDDEAMARRMQEELYGGGGQAGGLDMEGVRAPIGRTTETLVGPEADWGGPEDMHDAVLEQLRSRAAPRSSRPGVFNQQVGSSSIWDESTPDARRAGLAEATGGASEANSKAAKLAELFRPPFDLMSRVPWDDAREQGKEEEKWILVNIQDPSIFDCQALNRDIWKDEGIRETVKENFIFMQYAKDDPRGNQYMQYYFPLRDNDDSYPHIAIVDPRTGEQVKVWSGRPLPKAMDFLMQLHEFLDRYSLDATAKNPVAKRKAERVASLDVGRLSEEQQLEMALKASMGNGTEEKVLDPDDLTKSIDDISESKGKGKEVGGDEIESQQAAPDAISPFSQILSQNPHVEPANDPASTTRIQFRHSSGRIIHRFSVSDTIRRIYEWLKAEPIEGKQGEFELKAMGKDLIESLDLSIAEAGLKNATVMIEFLE